MPGFNYGGHGDGVGWSSERGDGPKPGGGSHGNSGSHDGNHGSSAVGQQISAIQNDPKIKQKLTGVLLSARKINPAAKMTLGSISPSGMMQVSIEGLTATQARQIGLGGLVMGFEASGYIGAVGDIDTGHRIKTPGARVPVGEATVDGFVNGKKPDGGWNTVANDSWTGKGPVDARLVNNAIKSIRIIRKGYVTGVLTPEEVMNKAEYKTMRQAFNALPLNKQNDAVKQIVAAWSLAYQDFPEHVRNQTGQVAERVINDIHLAHTLNKIAADMAKSKNSTEAASAVINEVSKAINDVNQKIAEKQKLKVPVADRMKYVQGKIDNTGKYSKADRRMFQVEKDQLQVEFNRYEKDISALKGQLAELNSKKQQAAQNKAAIEKAKDEKEALVKASELISSMGEKVGVHLGEKYRSVAKEIANDIKNFQGRTLRTHDQAMASLNKILANPGMKINKGDKDALINAWKSFNARDTANKLGNLSRAFKVADVAMKVEKVREKSITGYETGNWSPLMLEVESWVLSGMAAGVAMALFGSILSMLPISGLALTAITIAGIMAISYLSSKIDDKMAEKINNEVIKPAK